MQDVGADEKNIVKSHRSNGYADFSIDSADNIYENLQSEGNLVNFSEYLEY